MTKINWELGKVTKEEIVEHLKEFHQVDFNDRRALGIIEFIENHFPDLVQDCDVIRNDFYGKVSKKKIDKVYSLIKLSLKECETNGIPVVNVYDFNEQGSPEWRICKPTQDQIEYLRFKRWLAMIEGLANKTLLQGNLIEELALDEVLGDIKRTIIEGQKKRIKLKVIAN